jgi:hypothetical protein
LVLLLGIGLLALTCMPITSTGDFQPSGTQFNLNSGINVIRISGSVSGWDASAPYAVDFTDSSLTGNSQSDVLPAGLFLVSNSSNYQHLLIVRDYPVTAQAGYDTTLVIGVYCCNSDRHFPDDSATYKIGPTTDNSLLQQVVAITRHKQITDASQTSIVQDAVTSITDGNGLSQSLIDSLNSLPETTGVSSKLQVSGFKLTGAGNW